METWKSTCAIVYTLYEVKRTPQSTRDRMYHTHLEGESFDQTFDITAEGGVLLSFLLR